MASTIKTFTSTGQGTWTAPPGITTIQAEAWGGGAGGGISAQAEGGGGGGAYACGSAFPGTALTGYPYFVGVGGAVGANGGSAWFNGTTTVFAPGGLFPSAGTNAGVGGTAGVGTPKFAGGNGGSATVGTSAGAGGGGAASNSGIGGLGGNNSGNTGGLGGTSGVGGGGGGHGGNRLAAGTAGTAPGGGGAGGGTAANGAGGAAGQIKLTFTTPTYQNLTDNFDSNVLNTLLWSNWGGGNVVNTNQELEITGSTGGGYFGLDTTPIALTNSEMDLTGSYVSTQIIDAGDTSITSWEVYPVSFDLVNNSVDDTTNKIWWVVLKDVVPKIKAFKQIASVSTELNAAAYDSTVHKYFRLRESGGTFFWDYSTDGITFTNFTSVANPFSGGNAKFLLNVFAGNWQAEATATKAKLDNVNIFPSPAGNATLGYLSLLGVGI